MGFMRVARKEERNRWLGLQRIFRFSAMIQVQCIYVFFSPKENSIPVIPSGPRAPRPAPGVGGGSYYRHPARERESNVDVTPLLLSQEPPPPRQKKKRFGLSPSFRHGGGILSMQFRIEALVS